jgi:hypothetical protein|tara:strand:- start:3605 stop:3922 length:318 start_codon:yes stop_codon:yes gene_type:complete
MDINELKKQSDLSYDIAVAKRNALEKANSRQVIAYNEHLFRADPQTICLVKALMESHETFCVLDTNSNPVEITDPDEFLSVLIQRNQESLNAYKEIYKTFTKKGA